MSFPVSKVFGVKLRKSQSAKQVIPRLQMTSLIDVMTLLLVFLLKSFSSEGEIVTLSKGLELPVSSAEKKPKPSLSINVSQNEIMVGNKVIASVSQVNQQGELIILSLAAFLKKRKAMTEAIAAYSTTSEFKGEIIIQADRKLQYRTIQKIMYTCGQSGYSNFSLLVVKKD